MVMYRSQSGTSTDIVGCSWYPKKSQQDKRKFHGATNFLSRCHNIVHSDLMGHLSTYGSLVVSHTISELAG